MDHHELQEYIKSIISEAEYIPVAFIKGVKFEFFDGKTLIMDSSCFTQTCLKKEGRILSMREEYAIKSFQILVDIELVATYVDYLTDFRRPQLRLPNKK